MILLSLFLLVASPIILIWGIIRTIFSGGYQLAGELTGSEKAETKGERAKKRGYVLIIIGFVGTVIGALLWFWLV